MINSHQDIEISIIIPSYNSIRTIQYTMQSILDQDCPFIKEIIVVDSSENDNVEKYLIGLKNNIIRCIRPGVRIMPAIGRNIGAKKSSGNLLLFLDSDVILDKDYLSMIAEAFNSGKQIGGGGVKIPEFQINNNTVVAQYYLQLNEFLPVGRTRTKKVIPGCNIFCERSIFFEVGGFPEIRASEDTAFCHKLDSYEIWFLPKAMISHIFREDTTGFYANQRLLGEYIGKYRRDEKIIDLISNLGILTFPSFYILKVGVIMKRVLLADFYHILLFFGNLSTILAGLYEWTQGFISGIGRSTEMK